MKAIDELFVLSLLCDATPDSSFIRNFYEEKAQEWIKKQDKWLSEYLLLERTYHDNYNGNWEKELLNPEQFLNAYEQLLFLKKDIVEKSEKAFVELEKWFLPNELCVVKKEQVEPYQRFFEEIYHCFLYMVWILGEQDNPAICRYTGNTIKEQVQFLKEIILPYSLQWMQKKKTSYWYICKYSENDAISYEYCRQSTDFFPIYYRDNPNTEKIGKYLWRVNSEDGLYIGNGGYIKYFGVGNIHNLSVDIFCDKVREENIITKLPTASMDSLSMSDGIAVLETCMKRNGKKHYCVSPEDFTRFLNLIEMNKMAEIRKKNRLCPFCGNRIKNDKSICEKHGGLSLL